MSHNHHQASHEPRASHEQPAVSRPGPPHAKPPPKRAPPLRYPPPHKVPRTHKPPHTVLQLAEGAHECTHTRTHTIRECTPTHTRKHAHRNSGSGRECSAGDQEAASKGGGPQGREEVSKKETGTLSFSRREEASLLSMGGASCLEAGMLSRVDQWGRGRPRRRACLEETRRAC